MILSDSLLYHLVSSLPSIQSMHRAPHQLRQGCSCLAVVAARVGGRSPLGDRTQLSGLWAALPDALSGQTSPLPLDRGPPHRRACHCSYRCTTDASGFRDEGRVANGPWDRVNRAEPALGKRFGSQISGARTVGWATLQHHIVHPSTAGISESQTRVWAGVMYMARI
jgi:hypothetical protein